MGEARRRKLAGDTEPKVKRGASVNKRKRVAVGSMGGDYYAMMVALMMMTKSNRLPKYPW
jgi:hypothetical protein